MPVFRAAAAADAPPAPSARWRGSRMKNAQTPSSSPGSTTA